jgi:hypothetical protein
MKNPLTPAGIEPATYRTVAQHLNHCATAVPKYISAIYKTPADRVRRGQEPTEYQTLLWVLSDWISVF